MKAMMCWQSFARVELLAVLVQGDYNMLADLGFGAEVVCAGEGAETLEGAKG